MAIQKKRAGKLNISIAIPFLVLALVFAILVVKKFDDSKVIDAVPNKTEELQPQRRVLLLFIDPGTGQLVKEGRETDRCDDEHECVSGLLEELLAGPVSDLNATIPSSTVLNSVKIESGVALVDFSGAFKDDLPAGSSAEIGAVYSIVNTIALNHPAIKSVRITVDGEQLKRLGHLDLSEPLEPDFTLIKEDPKSSDKP